jgi:hypothetical protein
MESAASPRYTETDNKAKKPLYVLTESAASPREACLKDLPARHLSPRTRAPNILQGRGLRTRMRRVPHVRVEGPLMHAIPCRWGGLDLFCVLLCSATRQRGSVLCQATPRVQLIQQVLSPCANNGVGITGGEVSERLEEGRGLWGTTPTEDFAAVQARSAKLRWTGKIEGVEPLSVASANKELNGLRLFRPFP